MRWYVIITDSPGGTPFVLAESPDESWAREVASYWPQVTLSEEEALLDPDFREAVELHRAGDDSRHAALRAMEEADIALFDASLGIQLEEEGPRLVDPGERPSVAGVFDTLVGAPKSPEPFPAPPGSFYAGTIRTGRWNRDDPGEDGWMEMQAVFHGYIELIADRDGPVEAARWARSITRMLRTSIAKDERLRV